MRIDSSSFVFVFVSVFYASNGSSVMKLYTDGVLRDEHPRGVDYIFKSFTRQDTNYQVSHHFVESSDTPI